MKTKIILILATLLPLTTLTVRAQQTVTGQLTVNGPVVAGTNSSTDDFEFRLDGTLTARGPIGSGGTVLTSDQITGNKLLWLGGKGAFLTGYTDSYYVKDVNVGLGSVAIGYDNIASGAYSVAMGEWNTATNNGNIALGNGTVSGGFGSFAAGVGSLSYGWGSVAMGASATTGGGNAAISIGSGTYAQGNQTTAMGDHTTAASYDSFTLGRYNLTTTPGTSPSYFSWTATDPLLEVGNGTDATHLSDALLLTKNGNMTVQGSVRFSPGGDLSMGSFTAGTHP